MSGLIPRYTSADAADDVAAGIREHGVAIVERLVPEDVCDRLAAELAPYLEATPPGADDFTGRQTRRTGGLLGRSRSAVDVVAHPLVLDVVDQVLWHGKSSFQLHLTQAITLDPGAGAQHLHRDQWCFDFFEFPTEMQVEVATIWALTDFTEENGATRVIPGSHTWEDVRADQPPDPALTVPAVMPRGSVVIYTGRTIHGGGANRSDAPRTGVNVDYILGWLRQEENQYLSVPIEVVKELPERVQRLMGYGLGAYALGYIDDVRDPMELLRGGAAGGSSSFAPR
jgi:ectoine hydroxylase-related dioxygenase (phytanoyl-CoA dioxygenase family)